MCSLVRVRFWGVLVLLSLIWDDVRPSDGGFDATSCSVDRSNKKKKKQSGGERFPTKKRFTSPQEKKKKERKRDTEELPEFLSRIIQALREPQAPQERAGYT